LNLPHRVTIQTETRVTFGGGAYTTTWNTESTVWANCQVLGVSNDETYNKKQQFTKWKIVMRYLATLTNAKRLVYKNRILRIEGVSDPSNRKLKTVVICEEEYGINI
jgi:SPP1 family predicted phage head-tail adaptor